ncbi:MAG: DoxX protein [Gemmatimonadota bacterium]
MVDFLRAEATPLIAAAAAAAHERWFVSDEGYPTRWDHLFAAGTLVPLALAVGLTIGTVLAWRARGRRPLLPGALALGSTPERLAVLMGWVPLLLAVHTAVPLLVSGVNGQLFVPNLRMSEPADALLGLAQIGIALLLFYGIFARYAALGLAGLWLLGVGLFGPVLLIEHTIFLGIAAFYFLAGRGPVAVDRVFGPWAGAREAWLPWAIPALRVCAAVGFVWLALTEKLLNLPLALAFLDAYPNANFLPLIGVPVSDAAFVQMAGCVELTLGLLLLTGAFPRLVILVLWLPFNLTLAYFGWRELVGPLPIYATMAVLLIWGGGGPAAVEALRAGLIPTAEKPTGDAAEGEAAARRET